MGKVTPTEYGYCCGIHTGSDMCIGYKYTFTDTPIDDLFL